MPALFKLRDHGVRGCHDLWPGVFGGCLCNLSFVISIYANQARFELYFDVAAAAPGCAMRQVVVHDSPCMFPMLLITLFPLYLFLVFFIVIVLILICH
eukprot:COSAG05_NODE_2617_length_2832_cov_3.361142_4_plen_98_part_00